jgi:hypothetical protein
MPFVFRRLRCPFMSVEPYAANSSCGLQMEVIQVACYRQVLGCIPKMSDVPMSIWNRLIQVCTWAPERALWCRNGRAGGIMTQMGRISVLLGAHCFERNPSPDLALTPLLDSSVLFPIRHVFPSTRRPWLCLKDVWKIDEIATCRAKMAHAHNSWGNIPG